MKNLIKSKIFWMLVVIAAGIGTYFGFENNWWMQTENVEPVFEDVVETPAEATEEVEVIETIDSLEVVNNVNTTNTVE